MLKKSDPAKNKQKVSAFFAELSKKYPFYKRDFGVLYYEWIGGKEMAKKAMGEDKITENSQKKTIKEENPLNTEELKTWIRQERTTGTSDQDIIGIIKDKTGWKNEEISVLFQELGAKR